MSPAPARTPGSQHGGPPGRPVHDGSVASTRTPTNGRPHATIYALNAATWSGARLANGVLRLARRERPPARSTAAGLGRTHHHGAPAIEPAFRAVAASPNDPSVRVRRLRGLQLGTGAAQRFNGIAKTTDGGRTWRVVHARGRRPSPRMIARGSSARAGGRPRGLVRRALRPRGRARAPDVCLRDGPLPRVSHARRRRHWAQVNSREARHDRWTSAGST